MKLAELAPQVGKNENGRVGSPGSCSPRLTKKFERVASPGWQKKFAELPPQEGKNEVGRVGFPGRQK